MTLHDKKTIIEEVSVVLGQSVRTRAQRRKKRIKTTAAWLCMGMAFLLCGCYRDHGTVPPTSVDPTTEIVLTIGSQTFAVNLNDSASAASFAAMLPMQPTMRDLNGNEKYVYLDQSLPTQSYRPGTIEAGDLMLYGSNCLVLFYRTFASNYSYTALGRVETQGLQEALGGESVTVTFAAVEKEDR